MAADLERGNDHRADHRPDRHLRDVESGPGSIDLHLVTEDHDRIRKHQVLVDGDEEGYLLQIFTRNVVGPIFIEMIQRKNHYSFGEGNFGALFRSIERDQERRGVL